MYNVYTSTYRQLKLPLYNVCTATYRQLKLPIYNVCTSAYRQLKLPVYNVFAAAYSLCRLHARIYSGPPIGSCAGRRAQGKHEKTFYGFKGFFIHEGESVRAGELRCCSRSNEFVLVLYYTSCSATARATNPST